MKNDIKIEENEVVDLSSSILFWDYPKLDNKLSAWLPGIEIGHYEHKVKDLIISNATHIRKGKKIIKLKLGEYEYMGVGDYPYHLIVKINGKKKTISTHSGDSPIVWLFPKSIKEQIISLRDKTNKKAQDQKDSKRKKEENIKNLKQEDIDYIIKEGNSLLGVYNKKSELLAKKLGITTLAISYIVCDGYEKAVKQMVR